MELTEADLVNLITTKGPVTGAELLAAAAAEPFVVWKICRQSTALAITTMGCRYLRLDRRVDGYARLSPSILREFMTYSVIGLSADPAPAQHKAAELKEHIQGVSQDKYELARRLVVEISGQLAPKWPATGRLCFIIAGDITYEMAHTVPRPERSTGKLVNGSDIDLIVVGDDCVSQDFLKELDRAIYERKYYSLLLPQCREDIDYIVKRLAVVREQLLFDTFKHMVACKILDEGQLLSGSEALFNELKEMLVNQGVGAKLRELEKQAAVFRAQAVTFLQSLPAATVPEAEKYLFYTTEESEEFE